MWGKLDEDQEKYAMHTITLKNLDASHENFFLPKLKYTTKKNESIKGQTK